MSITKIEKIVLFDEAQVSLLWEYFDEFYNITKGVISAHDVITKDEVTVILNNDSIAVNTKTQSNVLYNYAFWQNFIYNKVIPLLHNNDLEKITPTMIAKYLEVEVKFVTVDNLESTDMFKRDISVKVNNIYNQIRDFRILLTKFRDDFYRFGEILRLIIISYLGTEFEHKTYNDYLANNTWYKELNETLFALKSKETYESALNIIKKDIKDYYLLKDNDRVQTPEEVLSDIAYNGVPLIEYYNMMRNVNDIFVIQNGLNTISIEEYLLWSNNWKDIIYGVGDIRLDMGYNEKYLCLTDLTLEEVLNAYKYKKETDLIKIKDLCKILERKISELNIINDYNTSLAVFEKFKKEFDPFMLRMKNIYYTLLNVIGYGNQNKDVNIDDRDNLENFIYTTIENIDDLEIIEKLYKKYKDIQKVDIYNILQLLDNPKSEYKVYLNKPEFVEYTKKMYSFASLELAIEPLIFSKLSELREKDKNDKKAYDEWLAKFSEKRSKILRECLFDTFDHVDLGAKLTHTEIQDYLKVMVKGHVTLQELKDEIYVDLNVNKVISNNVTANGLVKNLMAVINRSLFLFDNTIKKVNSILNIMKPTNERIRDQIEQREKDYELAADLTNKFNKYINLIKIYNNNLNDTGSNNSIEYLTVMVDEINRIKDEIEPLTIPAEKTNPTYINRLLFKDVVTLRGELSSSLESAVKAAHDMLTLLKADELKREKEQKDKINAEINKLQECVKSINSLKEEYNTASNYIDETETFALHNHLDKLEFLLNKVNNCGRGVIGLIYDDNKEIKELIEEFDTIKDLIIHGIKTDINIIKGKI